MMAVPGSPSSSTAAHGGLRYVLDCILDAYSVEVCFGAVGRVGAVNCASPEAVPDEVLARRRAARPYFVTAYELSGQGTPFPARPQAPRKRELGRRFFLTYARLLREKKPRMHRTKVLQDGFDGVLEGLAALHNGVLQGSKLVVFVPDQLNHAKPE